jgi:hypothetical protein
MGEKSLPARKGGEVRGSESIKFRAVALKQRQWELPPPGSYVAVLSPSLRSGGRESARHSLYVRLEELLGHENADTLMTSLPHHDSGHLATKGDVALIDGRTERLELRFDGLETKLNQQIRTYTVTTVGAMTALTAIFGVIVSTLG